MRIRRLVTRLASTSLVVILTGACFLVVFRGFRPRSLFFGFVFGVLISAINFWMLSRDVSRSRYAPRDRVEKWLFIHFLARYVVIGLAFAVCLVNPKLHIIGFVIGFVAFQLAIFWNLFRTWR